MAAPKPSLNLLRSLTDEHVLRALLRQRRLTRAGIAAEAGISKPTASESVQRLTTAGLVVDTGERTTGRGRVGSYYAVAEECGSALVAVVRPGEVQGEVVNPFGEVVARAWADLDRSAGEDVAARTLAKVAGELGAAAPGGLRCAAVSAADPVDRASGRLVPLPDVPFLVGELDPVAVLEPFVAEAVLVDNDVNWAARAEREHGCASGIDDFVHVHFGEGLGAAVVSGGRVQRGHAGLAGEIAHVVTKGPDGSAMALTEVFAALGLRRAESTAIDVDAVRDALGSTDVARMLARAACGALSSVVALVNPELVVLGGPWAPGVVPAVAEEFARWHRNAPVASGQVTDPEEAGARSCATEQLRERLIASARSAP